jgi:hypothetical protein
MAVEVAEPVVPEMPDEPVVHAASEEPETPLAAEPAHEPVSAREPPAEPELAPASASPAGPPLSAIERLALAGPRIRRRDRLLTAAWAASFAALAAVGVAGYTQRDALMRHWPASARVYAALGIASVDMQSPDAKGPADQPAH